jgi:archaellum component FlaC
MIQVTTADIREIKELIERIDNRFNELEKKVEKLDVSLNARFDKLDNRLWLFVMLILGTALTTIVKIFAFPTV